MMEDLTGVMEDEMMTRDHTRVMEDVRSTAMMTEDITTDEERNSVMTTGDIRTGEMLLDIMNTKIVRIAIHQDTMISMADIKNIVHSKCHRRLSCKFCLFF